MKRIAIFASFNREGIIAPFVVYFLKELRKEVEFIVFIADNEVLPEEEEKIKGIVYYSRCVRHGCYDFGSYRRGFEWADENGLLRDADELIFCNDSCYGPIFPFRTVFSEMKRRDCDFWGMTESYQMRHHLQSYFMVFKQKVFSSESFRSFVLSLEKQNDFWGYVEKYETRFTEYLIKAGFKCSSFCPYESVAHSDSKELINPCVYPVTLLSLGMPLVKRKVFVNKHGGFLEESQKTLMNVIGFHNPVVYGLIRDDSYEQLLDAAINRLQFEAKLADCKAIIESLSRKRMQHLHTIRLLAYSLSVVVVALVVVLVLLFNK